MKMTGLAVIAILAALSGCSEPAETPAAATPVAPTPQAVDPAAAPPAPRLFFSIPARRPRRLHLLIPRSLEPRPDL